MYKKATGGQQLTIFPFLFLMMMIGLGITAGVWMFYGKGYDFRQAESSLLNYKLTSCILEKDIDFTKDSIYDLCNLNKEIIEKNNIIKICKNSQDCVDSSSPLFFSGSNFQGCFFTGAKQNDAYPKCSLVSIKKQSDTYQIITGSKQLIRNKLA